MPASPVSVRQAEHGQFYTVGNPFTHAAFLAWIDGIPDGAAFLEPYAGANHLVRMVEALRPGRDWTSFDIEPSDPAVVARDTIASFPVGYDAVVTNPPYLAKNAAARRGMRDAVARMGAYDNLYKRCVADCLAHTGWVAAIIPEGFLTAGVFHERLADVISLPARMFDDTDQPVCLALWGPETSDDFTVWHGDEQVGSYSYLRSLEPRLPAAPPRVVFNDPDGQVGLLAVDSPRGPSIRFVPADEIARDEVKHSSRHRTRIHVAGLAADEVAAVLDLANRRLAAWRDASGDVGMTSFMGLRVDGKFRRRLSFDMARALLASAVADVRGEAS